MNGAQKMKEPELKGVQSSSESVHGVTRLGVTRDLLRAPDIDSE